jgi:hypothetical protein
MRKSQTPHNSPSTGYRETSLHLNMPWSSIGGLALLGDKALLPGRAASACPCPAILSEVTGLPFNNPKVPGLLPDIRPKVSGTPSSTPEVPGLLPPGRGDAKESELLVLLPATSEPLRVPSVAAVLGRNNLSAFD